MKKLTPQSVAKRYAVHVDTVRDWIRSDLLPATDCSRSTASRPRYRMDENDLAEFERRRSANHKIKDARQRAAIAERIGVNA
jgi:hypothetical protein